MRINASYWKENAEDKKDRRADWVADARRRAAGNEADAAAQEKHIESPLKETTKFNGILESAKPPPIKQKSDDTGEQRRDDEKKDKQSAAREKDSSDNPAGSDRIERNASSYGGQFGGSGGFSGGDINQPIHLSENFAARSILHIADLERMISVVRKQTQFDGKREITLELKRSVLEGLKVKITIGDAAQVQIEFLAADEKVRSQIENHSEELANILRGRGINLQSLRTSLDDDSPNNSKMFETESQRAAELTKTTAQSKIADSIDGNTFEIEARK